MRTVTFAYDPGQHEHVERAIAMLGGPIGGKEPAHGA
jgi:hypothetical protein